MTKKHLEFLASLINAAHNGVAPQHLATLAAAYCAEDNPRFDGERFFSACGLSSDGTPKVDSMYGLKNHAK